ncbi:hypothetical protein EUTSA_v10002808mg [Eutrema salsugineum]|uniref:MADS-box domain-containing protein n=1 Tax=Eutrema salsugineum TaxID=72664 RepID=V4KI24_EUTSA|nr:agamous-like MADS-box protein AGL53 [Eutrema salsugineum]ESQ37475.1 hypothetical protein EUTSA_v10002808mg [Eutrema salsugineum]
MDSSSSSSSSTKKMKSKLSVRRKQTSFKKSSSSVNKNIPSAKKKTDISRREQTLLNKAYELSTLCEIELCVIYYNRDGELIKTWPEDQSKVRDMAERFSKLSDKEKNKKSTNLSQFLNKKIHDEKKREGEDNKFSQKVLEIEDSLENHLQILQERLRQVLYLHDHQTESDRSRLAVLSGSSMAEEQKNQNFMGSSSSSGFFSTDTLMNLSNDQTSSSFATDSLSHHQSKVSIFLYNHENATLTQLADSVPSYDQALTPYNQRRAWPEAQACVWANL